MQYNAAKEKLSRSNRHTFCVQAVHHPADELQLVLQAKVDKVRVNEDLVRRCESCVVCEEERGRDLRPETTP